MMDVMQQGQGQSATRRRREPWTARHARKLHAGPRPTRRDADRRSARVVHRAARRCLRTAGHVAVEVGIAAAACVTFAGAAVGLAWAYSHHAGSTAAAVACLLAIAGYGTLTSRRPRAHGRSSARRVLGLVAAGVTVAGAWLLHATLWCDCL